MKSLVLALLLVTGCATGTLRTDIGRLTAEAARADTVRIVDSVEVVRTIVATDSVRDTLLLNLTDTVLVKKFITRVDTLKLACERCTVSAAHLSAVNDSLNRANATLVKRLDRQLWWQKRMTEVAVYTTVLTAGYFVLSRLRLPGLFK